MKLFPPRVLVLAGLLLALPAIPGCAPQPSGGPPILPDPQLTPGDTLDVTLADIQEHGYSARVRDVPLEEKKQVYAAYGIQHWNKGEYEVDHLIPLSIGGSNSPRNLWPQSYLTEPWNAHVKDQLEYKLLTLVREGKLDLRTAQEAIAHDWIAAYKQYVSVLPLPTEHRGERHPRGTAHSVGDNSGWRDEDPDTETAPAATNTAESGEGERVWVNTRSGVIWKPGSEFYGKTEEGKYMSADDALKAGYHYAGGRSN